MSLPAVQILQPRDVPLGGVRAMNVRRTLPHRERPLVGAWCFVDHYGPDTVGRGNEGGMDVAPHPHTGLSTVSWLFEGEIEHRDAAGVIGPVRPGEMNLMTSGHGISHSEVSTSNTTILHGVQLWVTLSLADRDGPRDFQHHTPEARPLDENGSTARVFIGELPNVDRSPVSTFSPLLGAQLDLAPGARIELEVDPVFEHAVLLDSGAVTVEGAALPVAGLGVLDPGRATLELEAGQEGARLILLGGEPFEEEVIMWWNFLGATHEEIVEAREQWQRREARFGHVPGYVGEVEWLPAPPMPRTRLKPRTRYLPEAPPAS